MFNQKKYLNINCVWFIVISLILLSTIFVRFYQLGNPDRGFYVDEAALGYNAYSILETGKDEFGKSFPVLFRSFGDFKASLYIYFSTIPVKFFGLNVFSTRIISALSGLLTILITFLFTKLVVKQSLKKTTLSNHLLFPALAALILATSPWHIFYSRGAWESNFSFFLLILASYLCFLGFAAHKKLAFLLGGILFVLSAYAYHSQRIAAPLIFIYYLIYYRKWLLENKKYCIVGLFILLLFALPLLKVSLTPGGQSRMKSVGFFSVQTGLPWQNIRSDKMAFLTNNHYLISARKWLSLYSAFFSPRNLFSPDPAEKQRWLVDLSPFYSWQFIFFMIGIICFFRKKEYHYFKKILLPWLIFSPVAASLTGDPFATQRTIPLIFPISSIIAIGIFESFLFLQMKMQLQTSFKYAKLLVAPLFLIIIVVSLLDLATQLFFVLPYQRASYWQIGYSKLGEELLKYPDNNILIDNSRGEGYIQILFFTKFDPTVYQKEASYLELPNYYSSFERVTTKKFGQFTYQRADQQKENSKGTIIVGDELIASKKSILENPKLKLIKEIEYPNQSVAFRIIQVKNDN